MVRQLHYFVHNRMHFGYFPGGRGGIVLFGTDEKEGELDERYDRYPFEIEFMCGEGPQSEKGYADRFHRTGTARERGALTLDYSADCGLKVRVVYRFAEGADAVEASACVWNDSDAPIRVSRFSWAHIGGLCSGEARPCDDSERFFLWLIRSAWCGEGKLSRMTMRDVYLYRTAKHDTRSSFDVSSCGSYTTDKFFPAAFVTDEKEKIVWYMQTDPPAPWRIRFGLGDYDQSERSFVTLTADSGSESDNGFYIDLNGGERYEAPAVRFGCTRGGVPDAVRELTFARRKARRERFPQKPIVFNDYMNCHWAVQNSRRTRRLIDAAAEIRPDVFCLDSGWYKKSEDDWFGDLGDWIPSPMIFEEGLGGILSHIREKGMIPGVWFELEVCTPGAAAAKKPEAWFLQHGGKRILSSGRFFFDFENPEVCDYLTGCVRRLYDLGVRYIKNDYNGNIGCGIDRAGLSPVYALERHAAAVRAFFEKLRDTFPDLMLENCGSGAMRETYHLLAAFDLQSTSDCEDAKKYPAVIGGTLLYLLPELCGNWCYPYPQEYCERDNENFADEAYRALRADGEETIFTLCGGFMGVPYLSGRADLADAYNLELMREGVALYREIAEHVRGAYPVFPLGASDFTDDVSPVAVGLRKGNKVLLAVWHKTGENEVFVPAEGLAKARVLFPAGDGRVTLECGEGGLRLGFTKPWQARLIEMELSE